jgi:ABC-type transport system substrate-binding protein
MSTPLSSLDPADASNISGGPDIQHIAALLFNMLTTIDNRGELQPSLAVTWKSDFNTRRWEFQLRPGVKFSDGTPVTAATVKASLQMANPHWDISSVGDSIVILSEVADPQLPAELALPQNSVLLRVNGKVIGTGPFTIAQWDAGKTLILGAREDCWAGRPFADAVEISLGRSPRDQMLSFDLGRIDVIDISPEQARRASANGSMLSSDPDELLALVFAHEPQSPEEARLRRALSSGIDRGLLNRVMLQSAGETTGGLLPNWMTGYEFIFPAALNLDHSREEHAGINQSAPWKLAYDTNDPVARVIGERLALNAQDAGLKMQLASAGPHDLQLVRIPLVSRDAHVALLQIAARLQLPTPNFHGGSAEELYAAENILLQTQRVIPLLHLRRAVGLGHNVRGWTEGQDGSWDLPNVWLSTEKP